MANVENSDNKKGASIFCPLCGARCNIRSSQRPTLLTFMGTVSCPSCLEFKGKFIGQITEVKRALYIDCAEAAQWDKPEKELLKEKGIRALSNEDRIRLLKGETLDFDLEPSS